MGITSGKGDRGRGAGVFLAGLVAGLAVALAINSFSVELQIEGGSCKYGPAKDGTFYQSDRLTNNALRTHCYQVGLAGQFKDSLYGWRVAYQNLGSIRTGPNDVTDYDEEAFGHLPQSCDPVTKHGCTAVMSGSGHNYGFTFSLTRRFPFKYFDVIGEAGLFFFRGRFDAHAVRNEDGGVSEVSENSSYLKPPAPLLGLGIRKGPVYAMYRRGWTLDHRELSLTDHSYQQLTVGLVWELWK